MKKLNRLFALLPLIVAFVFTACSNEEEIAQNNAAFEGYTFKVNAYIADGTRATGDTAIKEKWEHSDMIYFVIDDKVDNILTLTYDTLASTWDTKALNNAPEFAASGSIKAVYADRLSYDATNGIRTKGDVITTESGTYTKDGNVIIINMPMNNRPVMKITIVGVPDAFPCIKDFRECTYLDFSTMQFTDDGKFGLSNREQAISYVSGGTGRRINGTYNYYGYFDDDVTGNFTLATENMSSFWVNKTHTAASMQKGYQYVAKGPGDKEGVSNWTPEVEVLPVAKSVAMSISAGSVVRFDSLFTYQFGNPEREKYNVTSSNSKVLTPVSEEEGKTWILKAIENEDDRGSSQITVSTDDGSAQFNVTVDERKSVDGVAGLSFKTDSIIKRIVADNPTNAFSYCANEFFVTGSTYTYTSENEDVATISDNGIITMKEFTDADVDARGDRIKEKNVIITAKNNQNGLQFSFNIRVQEIDSYITATWGAAAYRKEVANSHGAGVQFTLTNGLGRNVYGMKLSGTTLSDVKDITVNSIRVAYIVGTSSVEKSITELYQIGSKYSPGTNKLNASEKGTGYYDLDLDGDALSWHINSTATIKYTFNGKQYEKQIASGNAKPE